MAIKKNWNAKDFAALAAARSGQTINQPYGTSDTSFPLFKTPVGQNLLVYIPKVNLITREDGTVDPNLCHSVTHRYNTGKRFGEITCIKGFPDGPVAEMLGYSTEEGMHTCPACEALSDCWDLVRVKTELVAKEKKIDDYSDGDERLKPDRLKFIQEMVLQKPIEYVTFPIVVLESKDNKPVPNAMETMKAYFVTMTKQRYEEKVCAGLASLFDNPGHILGRWMIWKYKYDSGTQQPIARDAAKNAQFIILTDAQAMAVLKGFEAKAEEVAAEFTNAKAMEVLTSLQPKTYDEIVAETNKVMKDTRRTLEAMNIGTASVALPTTTVAQQLAEFGATPATPATPAMADTNTSNNAVEPIVPHRFG